MSYALARAAAIRRQRKETPTVDSTRSMYSLTMTWEVCAESVEDAMEQITQVMNEELGYEGKNFIVTPGGCGECEECDPEGWDIPDIADHNPDCPEPYLCAASGDPCHSEPVEEN